MRKNLPAGSVLVNIARFRSFDFHAKDKENRWQADHYAAWVIPPASQQPVKLIDLGLAESIDREVAAFRVAIAEAGRPKTGTIAQHGIGTAEHFLSAPLNRLSQRILHPLLREIGAAEEIIVSPDSNLWLVPWDALLLPDKCYAIEQYAIRHLISGRELATDVVSRSNKGPLILADPDFDSHPLETQTAGRVAMRPIEGELSLLGKTVRVPFTAVAAQAIAPKLAQYTGKEPALFMGPNAIESIIKAVHRPRVVMLITHGFFLPDPETTQDEPSMPGIDAASPANVKPPENPLLRCGVLLAGCNQRDPVGLEDGILTGMEIVGTDFRGTELVVLNACDTGIGDVRNGEGVAGLRQAFQLAGAQAVVSTLWPVTTGGSAVLMDEFFANLANGQPKSSAPRNAQLMVIKDLRKKRPPLIPISGLPLRLQGSNNRYVWLFARKDFSPDGDG